MLTTSRSRQPAALSTSLALLLLAVAPVIPATGQTESRRADQAAREYFTDVELVNQYGETMRLYSDLIRKKIVLINSMYTDCPGMCPLMSRSIEAIQDHVGERLGRDVHLISISVDPKTDTPEKMLRFAERFNARRGWYFLTGEPGNVKLALEKLGQFVEDPATHQGIMIMGNTRTGLWKKAHGLANADALVELFDSVLEDRGPGGPDGSRSGGSSGPPGGE